MLYFLFSLLPFTFFLSLYSRVVILEYMYYDVMTKHKNGFKFVIGKYSCTWSGYVHGDILLSFSDAVVDWLVVGIHSQYHFYRPRSRGDNMFGSVRVFVCMYVGMCVRALKSATLLKNIIECSSQGAFKMVGHSKWLLFRQVAPSRSITLLMRHQIDYIKRRCNTYDRKLERSLKGHRKTGRA